MHPVANVGLSSTASAAATTILVWLLNLVNVTVPSNVTDAFAVLIAIGCGYAIHRGTCPKPAAAAPAATTSASAAAPSPSAAAPATPNSPA